MPYIFPFARRSAKDVSGDYADLDTSLNYEVGYERSFPPLELVAYWHDYSHLLSFEGAVAGAQFTSPLRPEWVGAVAEGERLLCRHLWTGGTCSSPSSPSIVDPLSRTLDPGWGALLARVAVDQDSVFPFEAPIVGGGGRIVGKRLRGVAAGLLAILGAEAVAGVPHELLMLRQARRGLHIHRNLLFTGWAGGIWFDGTPRMILFLGARLGGYDTLFWSTGGGNGYRRWDNYQNFLLERHYYLEGGDYSLYPNATPIAPRWVSKPWLGGGIPGGVSL